MKCTQKCRKKADTITCQPLPIEKFLTPAYLKSLCAERHIDEAGIGILRIGVENLLYASSCLRVLRHHIEIAATTSTWQLIAKAEVINHVGDSRHGRRVGATIDSLILQPCLTDSMSETFEIIALDSLIEIQRVLLHIAEKGYLIVVVEEHTTNNLSEESLCRTSDARIIEQMTLAILRLSIEVGREPMYHRILIESTLCLKELDALKESAILVLPATTGGEELLKGERSATYLLLAPCKTAEIVQRT